VTALLSQDRYIDLSYHAGAMRSCARIGEIQMNTQIAVMGHADGLCAIYLDETADRETAKRIMVTVEAKVSRRVALLPLSLFSFHSHYRMFPLLSYR
jgi:glutamate-5-semialdehyde dehydrogenase